MEDCKTYSREDIEQKVQELLQKLPVVNPMVQIGKICEIIGIKSVVQDKNYYKGKDGHIQIDDNIDAHIVINANKPATRKRFTVAHELAHFILHNDYLIINKMIDRDSDIIDKNYRLMEREANQFAASLLMPTEHFIKAWQAFGLEPQIQDIADFFGVSKTAAHYRAIELGLVSAS